MTVIRCVECGLQQFALSSICRRCHAELGISIIEIPLHGRDSLCLEDHTLHNFPIGTAILSLRRRQGLSQSFVSTRAHIARCTLNRIEHNVSTPSLATAARLLRVLGAESLYLRFGSVPALRTK